MCNLQFKVRINVPDKEIEENTNINSGGILKQTSYSYNRYPSLARAWQFMLDNTKLNARIFSDLYQINGDAIIYFQGTDH